MEKNMSEFCKTSQTLSRLAKLCYTTQSLVQILHRELLSKVLHATAVCRTFYISSVALTVSYCTHLLATAYMCEGCLFICWLCKTTMKCVKIKVGLGKVS